MLAVCAFHGEGYRKVRARRPMRWLASAYHVASRKYTVGTLVGSRTESPFVEARVTWYGRFVSSPKPGGRSSYTRLRV